MAEPTEEEWRALRLMARNNKSPGYIARYIKTIFERKERQK